MFLCCCLSRLSSKYGDNNNLEAWNLPVVPTDLTPIPKPPYDDDGHKKMIPSNWWISTVEIPSWNNMPKHLKSMIHPLEQKGWTIRFAGEPEMNAFMSYHFANTSLLWAYQMLHPSASVGLSDIWRIAALYVYGGVYMDDDSYFAGNLDKVQYEFAFSKMIEQ
jgi:hypothetical protein